MPKQSSVSLDLDASVQKIYSFFEKNGRMPSYSEICILCSISSKNTAHNLVKKLCATGQLKIDSTGKIIPNKDASAGSALRTKNMSGSAGFRAPKAYGQSLTLLGLVEAGFPTPSEESMHDKVSLDEWVIEKKRPASCSKSKGIPCAMPAFSTATWS